LKLNPIIIDNIPFSIQAEHLYPLLKIKSNSTLAGRLGMVLDSAIQTARPKVAFKVAAVERSDDGKVLLDGIRFKSSVLQVNLRECRRAFPFVATCGMELHDWSQAIRDPLESFWADTVCMLALGAALDAFKRRVHGLFETNTTSTMNPGSLADWPLTEQPKLFSLLGDSTEAIGVRLTPAAMMVPLKSVSGIEFESGEKFVNCRLCPRDKCQGRRALYDEHLFAEKYKS
jgi:hypothetical protein